jgi:hypothetical protein
MQYARGVMERFWEKVAIDPDGCWVWTAYTNRDGYGRFLARMAEGGHCVVAAHRFIYEAAYGPIPDGLTVDHLCGNRRCVRPTHLEAVPLKVNIQRSVAARWSARCPRGHLLDRANSYTILRVRFCRACQQEWKRISREVKKGVRAKR